MSEILFFIFASCEPLMVSTMLCITLSFKVNLKFFRYNLCFERIDITQLTGIGKEQMHRLYQQMISITVSTIAYQLRRFCNISRPLLLFHPQEFRMPTSDNTQKPVFIVYPVWNYVDCIFCSCCQ